jgi:glycosyltransferase involved in cell wall biosynthesis
VYNRPQEIKELLESFKSLDYNTAFEIVIVEDGSTETSQEVIASFEDILNISYFQKENTGPGDSRNYGMERARGNYFIILDSDCMLPVQYLNVVHDFLNTSFFDCYGAADAAHSEFTPIQKAINYTMTSFFTTGGIRGSEKSITHFEPRSFNMGISKEAFQRTGGFSKIHPGEDPDLSQRIIKAGFKTTFIPDAFVYHKRRISWSKFYAQVKKFGTVRPILNKWHPQAAKITFWLPSLFVFFVIASIVAAIVFHWLFLVPPALYLAFICIDSAIKNKSISVGILSVCAVMIQFFGYGIAFLKSTILIGILKKDPEKQFPHLFFK